MDVFDFSTQEVLGGSCSICMATLKGGYSGFKSGDSEVILKRLGPLMGRVSYKQEVLKSCNTLASPVIYLNVSLSWFKTFPILVWLLLMLLQLGPRRNHTSIYTEKLKEDCLQKPNSRFWDHRKIIILSKFPYSNHLSLKTKHIKKSLSFKDI